MILMDNIKLVIYANVSVIIFTAGWITHKHFSDNYLEKALEEQKNQLIVECEENKAITDEVSHDFQESFAIVGSRVDALRMQPARCILPIAISSAGRNGSSEQAIDGGENGISTAFLIDYAALAEKYRLQLIGCQDYVNRVKKKFSNTK